MNGYSGVKERAARSLGHDTAPPRRRGQKKEPVGKNPGEEARRRREESSFGPSGKPESREAAWRRVAVEVRFE
ncbi:hypothetical protein NDU88_001542 [Pleurodeles waltl]|uniref:Uncharacterized protein n=1 Tax=Pleurodeles waltl TaxID=8319 RepID=A0AAV7RBW8_PLEWA|nr:hypothetical protein NDU88_001542 [Pleurodeles waltl]